MPSGVAGTLLARQKSGGVTSALPPRNGPPANENGTVYDEEQWLGSTTGSSRPAVTGPSTKLFTAGAAPAAECAPSSGVCATVWVRSSPSLGVSVPAAGFSSVSRNSRSSHWLPSGISLVRIWLIAFWLPLSGAAPWVTTLSVIDCSCARYAAVKPGDASSRVHCFAQLTTLPQPLIGTPYSKIVVKCLRPQVASVPPPHGLGWTTPKMKRSSPAVVGAPVGRA